MMSGFSAAGGDSKKNKRNLYKISFKGFSPIDETGKLRVKCENCEIDDGNVYPAYALKKATIPGTSSFPLITGQTFMRVALPADVVDGIKMENPIVVCADNSVYR